MINRPKQLKEEKTLEKWSYLIGDANGKEEEIYNSIVRNIEEVKPEAVSVRKETIMPQASFSGFFKNRRREFLIADNSNFKSYKIYVGVRDYGKQLLVSWYLVCEPGILGKLSRKMAEFKFMPLQMNLFDEEELTAYTTTVHHAVLDAVKEVMEGLNQDFAKVDRKSKGFLNIS